MHVILLAVQSLDGFITRHDTPGSHFASSADQKHLSQALQNFDCSIMGGTTYRISRDVIKAQLKPGRLRIILTQQSDSFASDTVPGVLEFSSSQPRELLSELSGRGCQRCALLGGAQVYSLFLENSFVDEAWITVEPRLFGRGTSLLTKAHDLSMQLQSVENLSANTLLLKYRFPR